MPRSVPVSRLMIPRREWPLLRAETSVRDAIRILRILSEEKKLERGHSTPLVVDDDFNLLGMIQLTDLLRSVRHLCEGPEKSLDLGKATNPVRDIVNPFPASVKPEDSILEALDIMTNHGIPLVPVMSDGELEGLILLADIFSTVAALLFDEEESDGPSWIYKYLH